MYWYFQQRQCNIAIKKVYIMYSQLGSFPMCSFLPASRRCDGIVGLPSKKILSIFDGRHLIREHDDTTARTVTMRLLLLLLTYDPASCASCISKRRWRVPTTATSSQHFRQLCACSLSSNNGGKRRVSTTSRWGVRAACFRRVEIELAGKAVGIGRVAT